MCLHLGSFEPGSLLFQPPSGTCLQNQLLRRLPEIFRPRSKTAPSRL